MQPLAIEPIVDEALQSQQMKVANLAGRLIAIWQNLVVYIVVIQKKNFVK